jgi:hypothetical protein
MTDHDPIFSAIDRLIGAAAPERLCELASLWNKYGLQFILGTDQARFTLEVAFDTVVIFTNKTLLQIWLLGFAAWRAVEAYAGIIRYYAAPGIVLDFPSVSALPHQSRVDAAFDRIISTATALGKAEGPASVSWPEDVPPAGTETFSIPDKAAYDLICIATAYFFLHEVKHVAFAQDEGRPKSPIAEEMACDRFAKDFLLSDVPAFARMIESLPARCSQSGSQLLSSSCLKSPRPTCGVVPRPTSRSQSAYKKSSKGRRSPRRSILGILEPPCCSPSFAPSRDRPRN